MKAIILAGGKGTRLRPLTYTRPKGLVPVANKAFLDYQIELLRLYGFNEIVLSLNYRADDFKSHFGDGSHWGLSIAYVVEERPLGTGGAIKNCEPHLDGEPVLVLNGDVLTDINLAEIVEYHKGKGGEVTLTLTEVSDPTIYGLVLTDNEGRVTGFLEKPGWEEVVANTINAGIYVLEPSFIRKIPAGREVSLEREVFPALLKGGLPAPQRWGPQGFLKREARASPGEGAPGVGEESPSVMWGYISCGYWLDIGSIRKYLQAHYDILDRKLSAVLPGRNFGRGIYTGKGNRLYKGSRLVGPVALGNYVTVEAGAQVGPWAVIGDRSQIASGAVVCESVVLDDVVIGREARLRHTIVDSGCEIKEGCIVESTVIAAKTVLGKGSLVDPELARTALL